MGFGLRTRPINRIGRGSMFQTLYELPGGEKCKELNGFKGKEERLTRVFKLNSIICHLIMENGWKRVDPLTK